jgi:coenzyme F420-reducing hydrogenase delta subunit
MFEKELDIAFVDSEVCDGCELCVEACPYDAIDMVEVKEKDKTTLSMKSNIDAVRCKRCGSCARICPTGAVQLSHFTDSQVSNQLKELLSDKIGTMFPKVVAFCCDECGYATVDMMGMGGLTYPANVLPIRVPCLGWVSLNNIFKALEYGADGILLVGCMLKKCQHLEGDVHAGRVVEFAKEIMDEIGLNGSRIEKVFVCAADPVNFSEVAKSLIEEVKKLNVIATRANKQ